mmetsp:Transcript_13282/g.43127  ORF Transcript_13282/g.43127 Transcript_13282/m.43127 type:complete len:455 (+) Transcript_13282:79-1443(+)
MTARRRHCALTDTLRHAHFTTRARQSAASGSLRAPLLRVRLLARSSLGVALAERRLQVADDGARRRGDARARPEDALHSRLVQQAVVLLRDDAAGHHHRLAALRRQLLDERRQERAVARRLRRDADHVHVCVDRLQRNLGGRRKERADVDVEAQVGKGGGDDVGAAVVPVLPHLRDKDAWATPVPRRKLLRHRHGRLDLAAVAAEVAEIGARADSVRGRVPPPLPLERVRDLAHRRARPRRVDCQREEVAVVRRGGGGERRERLLQRGLVALGAQPLQLRLLRRAHVEVVDDARLDDGLLAAGRRRVLVDPDDDVVARVDARLLAGGANLDPLLWHAGGDRLGHAAERLHLLDDGARLLDEPVGERLHHVGAAPRVNHVGNARLLGEDELRVARERGGEVGRQSDGLVKRVCVQRLRAAHHRGHRLDRGADHVVVRLLRSERPAACLAVRAQQE